MTEILEVSEVPCVSSFCDITRIYAVSTRTTSAFCLGSEIGHCSEAISLW